MPFIAAPVDEFTKFKEDLQAAHPDQNIVCTRLDWCYFIGKCEEISKIVEPLTFTFGDRENNKTFSIPSESFLIPNID